MQYSSYIFCIVLTYTIFGLVSLIPHAIAATLICLILNMIRLILAMLRRFYVYVEQILHVEGLAAQKLEERMRQCLALREGPDGQW